MSRNPINLVLRFALELCMLAALAYGGWNVVPFPACFAAAVLLPLAAAAVWAVFRVPGDGGKPRIAVSGRTRLAQEAMLFLGAAALLAGAGRPLLALAFAAATAIHYALSWDRVAALLRGDALAPDPALTGR
ncbi:MAG TPA: DUF2568 domain-containing protein [Longimicrobiaceae bacterium]|nr:DUF2568 domain-containing protein [Longimicrobiaceae bacterium]